MAEAIHDFFQNPRSRELVRHLLELGVKPASPEAPAEGPLSGKTLVITGTLAAPRAEVELRIRAAGGSASSSVSKKTDYVLAGDNPGSKLDKARKLGVEIIDEKRFEKLIRR